jgi:hypothetical protein
MNEDNFYLIMENSLLSNLRPVQPNPDFIQNLGKRLSGSNNISIESRNNGIAFVLISLGLFLGVLLVWLFRKH